MQRSLLCSNPVVLRDNLFDDNNTSSLELSLQDFKADVSAFAFLALDCSSFLLLVNLVLHNL